MKWTCFAVAVTYSALSGLAQAQSGVTLYGVVDTNIEYVNHLSAVQPTQPGFPGPAQSRVAMMSGGLSGSRWGLRGTEELGSGARAVFVLESGFALDDGRQGQGGRLFGRQAFVGLQKDGIGRLTFGRQYSTLFDAMADYSPARYGTQYEPAVAQLGPGYRSDNAVKYVGKFGGLTANAYWSFGNGATGAGEVPGQFRRDTAYGAALSYSEGPFGMALAYDQYNPTRVTATGATGDAKKVAVAANYAAGRAKIMGGYRWGRSRSANDTTLLRDDYYWAGVSYDMTPTLGLTLAYYYEDIKSLAGENPKNPWQVSFIADYNLSKRTDLYLSTAYAKNSGLNFDTSAISFANGYFPGQGKNDMFGVAIGMRHRF
ncbi:porin [Cupriavidus basilensis]|uniref:Porin n=1 Tax=Cupriavidus basilensis TaxID=68895 RepID=A0ABT6AG27_9BURK|nr:porin [Cupriavidus basilensis]MDF3831556.1 porin [Cupriavidus basilensis]